MDRAVKKTQTKTLEQRLRETADALRGNQEPSEYKHIVLGMVFLKYISNRFEGRCATIEDSLSDPSSTDYILTTRAAEIIAEFVRLAKEMRDQNQRHEKLGLSVAEAAFYDAIVQNDSAVLTMGGDTLKKTAIDLVWQIQGSITIDWNYKSSVKAEMRAKVRRLLAKYDYPPDLEVKAVELVLQQAELFAESGSTGGLR